MGKGEKKNATVADEQIRIPSGGENIEQIRHLLFGPQVKNLDKKIMKLDDRLTKELGEMRDDVNTRLDSLESFLKSELESLVSRLGAERQERSDADKQLTGELRESVAIREKKAEQLEKAIEKSSRDMREYVLQQNKTLSEEIHRKHQQASDELKKAMSILRDEHVDRTFLSSLFTETALRLSDDLMDTMLPGVVTPDEG